eukprot:Rhum_TRINITY_DN3264_c0_g1::Rhum_TRINITY_DN3264_c0_g1_i1::g.10041::m.10041
MLMPALPNGCSRTSEGPAACTDRVDRTRNSRRASRNRYRAEISTAPTNDSVRLSSGAVARAASMATKQSTHSTQMTSSARLHRSDGVRYPRRRVSHAFTPTSTANRNVNTPSNAWYHDCSMVCPLSPDVVDTSTNPAASTTHVMYITRAVNEKNRREAMSRRPTPCISSPAAPACRSTPATSPLSTPPSPPEAARAAGAAAASVLREPPPPPPVVEAGVAGEGVRVAMLRLTLGVAEPETTSSCVGPPPVAAAASAAAVVKAAACIEFRGGGGGKRGCAKESERWEDRGESRRCTCKRGGARWSQRTRCVAGSNEVQIL